MNDIFLYVCDDYNKEWVERGTKAGLEKINADILAEKVAVVENHTYYTAFLKKRE
jgi:hypothetical protein